MPTSSMPVAGMIDPLTLLDEAIDRLTSDVSSRCSRSGLNAKSPTGTVKSLESDTVPAVPVVPGQNGRIHENDMRSHGIDCLNFSSTESKVAHASAIQKTPGTTGTAGTGLRNQCPNCSQIFFENGNNGNRDNLPDRMETRASGVSGLETGAGHYGSERRWELPDSPCRLCGLGAWWRLSVLSGGPGPWHCERCEPPNPQDWLDGCAVPGRVT